MHTHKFYKEHYENAIFRSKLPTVAVTPFEIFPHSPYRDLTLPMSIFVNDEDIIHKGVGNSLELIENATNMTDLRQCSVVLLGVLKYTYFKLKQDWWTQSEYIKDIVGTAQSNIMWECYKHEGKEVLGAERLNDVQKLWIYMCSLNDKRDEQEREFSMFEYLSGFVNPEMYSAINKKDDMTRENANYDEMHDALMRGDLDAIEKL